MSGELDEMIHQSPLLKQHEAAGAALGDVDGWRVPLRMADQLEAEVTATRNGVVVADLSWMDVLVLQGEELRRWANGMFTNNIKRLSPGAGNRNAMCDDRGRVQGLMDLYCVSDTRFVAVLDGVDADWFEGRYRMFLILDDIEVTPRPDGATVLTVQGPGAGQLLSEVLAELSGAPIELPAADRAHLEVEVQGDPLRIARRDRISQTGIAGTGFDLILPSDLAPVLWQTLVDADATPIGAAALDALRILAGRARWPTDGTDKSMVHELRLEGEVCAFDKGCYVGQEIINRIDVKGAVNKRITAFQYEGDPVEEGAAVMLGDRKVGQLTSQVKLGETVHALGVLRKQAWEPGTELTIQGGSERRSATVVAPPR